MISDSFLAASQAAEESLGLLIVIENRADEGNQKEAKKLLKTYQVYSMLYDEVIRAAQPELAAVSDREICWSSPSGRTSYFSSVHAAVASLWVLLDVLSYQSDFVVPPDFRQWLGVNLSQLSAGLVRERSKLPADSPGAGVDAFVPIGSVWENDFPSYPKAKAFLDGHEEIRRRKPSPQRLEVHAGDWFRCLAKQNLQREPSDEVVDNYLEGIEQRKKGVREGK